MSYSVMIAVVFAVLSVVLFFYLMWMRFKARYAKTRFALYVVATIFSILVFTVFSLTSVSWSDVLFEVLRGAGLWSSDIAAEQSFVGTIVEKISIVVLSITATICVMVFANRALKHWDGPVTMNAVRLENDGRANDILALAYAEMSSRISGQNDPVLDQRAVGWKQQLSPAPGAVEFKDLVRAAFLSHLPESAIESGSWRQQSQSWVGTLFGPAIGSESNLVILVFEDDPSDEELSQRLKMLQPLDRLRVFAIIEQVVKPLPEQRQVLGVTIEVWGYDQLVRAGLPLQNYARQLLKQFEQVTVGGTSATLSQTFVPARVTGDAGEVLLQDLVQTWLEEPGRKHLTITGEYGQGKSTAMLSLCVDWARRYLSGEASVSRVPLLIELRGKSPGDSSPADFLAQWGTRYGFQAEKLLSLIQSGQTLLIFEGFDELKNAGRQYERHEHFNALWKFAYPGVKIIFTGRPNFFIDQNELNSTLRVDGSVGAASNAFTEKFTICMFNEVELVEACRAYTKEVRDGIKKTFEAHADFREIVVRPSMLPVVATIWPEIREAEIAGRSITGSMLLERYLSAVYERKEAELERESIQYQMPELSSYILLPRAVREALTLAVVWTMAAQDLRNTITRSYFDQIIGSVFDNVLRALQSSEVRTPTLEAARSLAARMASENRGEFLEKVCTDVASAGLFVPDPAGGPSSLRFAHKQYFEYLTAKFAWLRIAMPDSETVKALLPAKVHFNSSVLLTSEAIFPFNRILDRNLGCFDKYYAGISLRLRYMMIGEQMDYTIMKIALLFVRIIEFIKSKNI